MLESLDIEIIHPKVFSFPTLLNSSIDHSFVTRKFPLTDAKKNMNKIQSFVDIMQANGGGDTPESLDPAMHDLVRMNWRKESTKAAVVITDAPPHGIGSGGDGFPEGDPSGVEWMVQCESLQEIGCTLHTVTCGASGRTKQCLQKMAEICHGVCVDLSNANVLPDIITGATSDAFDKMAFMKQVEEMVLGNVDMLGKMDEAERIEWILSELKGKKVVRRTLEGSKIIERAVELSDVVEAVSNIRRLNPAGKLCDVVSTLFPYTGLSDLPLRAGLYDKQDEDKLIPLKHIAIHSTVYSNYAQVQIQQVFVNSRSSTPIEALYKFPVSAQSTVFYFSCEIDGKLLVGKCLEKEKARERYTDALAEGNSAFLLEEVAPELFSIAVGNLLPGKTVKINISFFYQLVSLGVETTKLVIPTTFAPKSTAAIPVIGDGKGGGGGDGDGEMRDDPYQCKITASVAGKNVKKVESGSHSVKVSDEFEVELENVAHGLDGDFSLIIHRDVGDKSLVVVEEQDEIGVGIMVDFLPKFDSLSFEEVQRETEVVILVDCSSSVMYQTSQLQHALKSVCGILTKINRKTTFFNIVLFASDILCLYEGASSRITDENLATVGKWAAELSCFGGSEILETLEKVKRMKKVCDDRAFVLISDGNFPNSQKVLKLTKELNSRFFCIGVSVCPNRTLLTKISAESGSGGSGGGFTEFAAPMENISGCVTRQFERIFQSLTDVTVEPKELDFGPAPLITSARNSVFAILPNKNESENVPKEMVLRGKNNAGKHVEIRLSLDASSGADVLVKGSKNIHTIASKYLIQKLESDEKESKKDEIVKLAVNYNVASKYTSFLAINENETKVEQAMEVVDVPNVQPKPRQQQQQQQPPPPPPPSFSSASYDGKPVSGKLMKRTRSKKKEKKKKKKRDDDVRYFEADFISEKREEEESCRSSEMSFCMSRAAETKKKSGFGFIDFSSGSKCTADAIDGIEDMLWSLKEKKLEKKKKEIEKKKQEVAGELHDKWHFKIIDCLAENIFYGEYKKKSSVKVLIIVEKFDKDEAAKNLTKYRKLKGFVGSFSVKAFFVFNVFYAFTCSPKQLEKIKKFLEKQKDKVIGVKKAVSEM